MDINRLNEFIALATHLNYSKAANQLFLTQPALSRHIHDLEETLGAQLFIRDTHNVHLTAVGELFFQEAKEIVDHYNHALELVREASSSTTGQITIGFLGAAVQPFLSSFIPEFSASHPNIKLTMHCDDMDNLVKQLNEDAIDLCFATHIDSSFFTGLQSETILTDRLMIVTHPKHPLASKESVCLSDLNGYPMIAFSKKSNPIACDFHKQLLKKANVPYNAAHEISNLESAFFLVSINEGYFIIPAHLKHMAKDLCAIPLTDKNCTISLNLIWKKSNSNPSLPIFQKAFMNHLQNTSF